MSRQTLNESRHLFGHEKEFRVISPPVWHVYAEPFALYFPFYSSRYVRAWNRNAIHVTHVLYLNRTHNTYMWLTRPLTSICYHDTLIFITRDSLNINANVPSCFKARRRPLLFYVLSHPPILFGFAIEVRSLPMKNCRRRFLSVKWYDSFCIRMLASACTSKE